MTGQNNDDEFGKLKKDVGEFMSAPRIKSAFNAASTPLKIAGGALALGLLWKPALLVAAGSAIYAGLKAADSFDNNDDGGNGPSAGGGAGGNGGSAPKGPSPDDLTL